MNKTGPSLGILNAPRGRISLKKMLITNRQKMRTRSSVDKLLVTLHVMDGSRLDYKLSIAARTASARRG